MLLKYKKCPNCGGYYDPTLEKCPHCYKHNELYLNREISTSIAYFHPIAQIGLFLVGYLLAGMTVAQLIIHEIIKNFGMSDSAYSATLISLTYLIILIGLLAIVLTTRRKHFFSKYQRSLDYIYGIGYAFTLFFVTSIVGNFVSIFYKMSDNINQSAADAFANNYPILAFFVMAIIGPICEELTYRVGLYSFLRRINKYLAIIISSIVFALIHFSFKQETIVNELWSLPTYIVSGVILALAYEHKGPACSMTAHILYNTLAFIVLLGS